MRTFGILALVGAGVGLLLGTERGRSCLNQAGQMLQDGYGRMTGRGSSGGETGEVGELVQEALSRPHEDTPLARAFEEAATAA